MIFVYIFFCSSFRIEGDFIDFNRWNIRNCNLTKTIDDALSFNNKRRLSDEVPSSLQSELLREDVCDFYHISRSALPALVFINKREEVYTYPIKDFKDIKALLTPLGIISDFLKDKAEIDSCLKEIRRKKQEADLKINRFNELTMAIGNAIPKSEFAQKLINEIINICRNYDFDEVTLKKMYNHPEKIRQIMSMHHIDDMALSDKLFSLKNCISQYRIVKKGSMTYLQREIEKLTGIEYENWEKDIKKEEEKLKECTIVSINKLKELNLNIDADTIINQSSEGKSGMWLIPILKASQERQVHEDVTSDNKMTLKCLRQIFGMGI